MSGDSPVTIRPARRGDTVLLIELLQAAARRPGAPPAAPGTVATPPSHWLVAVAGTEVVGAVHFIPGAGRCVAVEIPYLLDWDAGEAAALLAAARTRARQRHRARLIQTLLVPEGADPAVAALRRAGFDSLATLLYMRRRVRRDDLALPTPDAFAWRPYTRLRRQKFAETIGATYHESLDCPGLAGLRTVYDSLSTHRHTGRFRPKRWRLALLGRSPVGVAMVNELNGRGELVYLGVVPEGRGRGIGRALLRRAVRDTAEMGLGRMGLAVDAANTPAIRLYRRAGFTETHRRLAYFVPPENLDAPEA